MVSLTRTTRPKRASLEASGAVVRRHRKAVQGLSNGPRIDQRSREGGTPQGAFTAQYANCPVEPGILKKAIKIGGKMRTYVSSISEEVSKVLQTFLNTNIRRVDGTFFFTDSDEPKTGKTYRYSAYRIVPVSGDPTIRIDIKEVKI